MRALAIIFCFYILFLAVLPTFQVVSTKTTRCSIQKKCCHSHCQKTLPKSKEKNKDCTKGHCSPFCDCNNIQVIMQQKERALTNVVIEAKKYLRDIEFFTSGFLKKSWHPPKFII